MNVLFRSPVGGLLARPWLDAAGLTGLRRYLPLSRLWAAANAAGDDASVFAQAIGADLSALWPTPFVQSLLRRNRVARDAAVAARRAWEERLWGHGGGTEAGALDRARRVAATRHLWTRTLFYPLLLPRRPPTARWCIVPPGTADADLAPLLADPAALYAAPGRDEVAFERSASFVRSGVRESWLRAPTPARRLRGRCGSETLYARVVEPAEGRPVGTLILGSGLGLETELLAIARDPGIRLAELGWRAIEPVSPYHGLRAMPGYYGGEPFFALGPTSAIDLIAGQTAETAALVGWARAAFGGKVAVGGISMTSFVAQQVASWCGDWPGEMRADAVLLISHSGRVEDVTLDGDLASVIGLGRALGAAGWTREKLARISSLIDPSSRPAIPPQRIVSVLGETDRWVHYRDGLDLVRRWQLPEQNVFRYRLGHLGMPVQLVRDSAPFDRLRQVLETA
jgi:hypothetical protein